MAIPHEMLLHPELLSNEQLKHIIQERQLRIPNMESMQRCDLLELFHNFCVPYGQRKYRDSGRGKILNKNRHMSPEPKPKLNTPTATVNNNQNRKLSYPWVSDRLKPPPDMLAGHPKIIRIDGDANMTINMDSCKRKATPATDSPPPKKGRKPITWP